MSTAQPYREPPPDIAGIVDAPPTPAISLHPRRTHVLLVERASLPPIADLAAPMLRLAGSRINPNTNGPHGPRSFVGLTLQRLDTGSKVQVQVPPNADLGFPSWSPDGSLFAFTNTTPTGVELWVGNVESGQASRLTEPTLNAAGGTPMSWMPDGQRLICRFIPAGRGPAPARNPTPLGPVIQESTGGSSAPVRTFQDLLTDAHDEAMFDHVMTSQLAIVDARTGARNDLGSPAIHDGVSPSPDGQYLLVSRLTRPYSYQVVSSYFPAIVEVWSAQGQVVAEIARNGLLENIPIQGVKTGPRSITWRDSAPSTLVWSEALDGGDPKNKVPQRDKLMMMPAPFDRPAVEVLRTEHRLTGVSWMEDPGRALVSEYDRDRRWIRTWLHAFGTAPAADPVLIWDRSQNERYNHPGTPLSIRNQYGRSVIRVSEGMIHLAGAGATPEGDRPFLDRMNLADRKVERLWRCGGANMESVVDILDPAAERFITAYESPTEPSNYYVRDRGAGTRTAITAFPDPHPQLQGISRQLVTYTRADGVPLSATLYLPPGHEPGTRLPLVVWAYPLEYSDAGTAGQVTGSPNRFTRVGGFSHLFFLLRGYAIMDNATMPVIGDPETVNDTFVEQITAGAKAAIDKAVEMGVADPERVGVGGHSYGAFMTANLLAHTDLFKAGIARSGAYNRTLTPFGFQGERRTYWEAVDTYTKLSPFTHANKINEPLLMIHGQLDSNTGTFPMQSERLFHAIKGTGGRARLVMLPYEDHGYESRESVMHTLAEMLDWFDAHVKGAGHTEATP